MIRDQVVEHTADDEKAYRAALSKAQGLIQIDEIRKTAAHEGEVIDHMSLLLDRVWQEESLRRDRPRLEIDARRLYNRARGYGFLSDYIPPARTDLSDLVFNADGILRIRPKGEYNFVEVEDRWPLETVQQAINGGLLREQGKSLSEATVSVDAKISTDVILNGVWLGRRPVARIKALHPRITSGNQFPALALRFYEDQQVTPDRLLEWEVMPRPVLDQLLIWVGEFSRIMIAGGTGTGKTTMLSALSHGLDPALRIVKIEDPEELWLPHPDVQTLEARPAQAGVALPPYTIADGVDDAMRMAPHYLIVGEVRTGDAALALFRAFMSDHPGMTTFHGTEPASALRRLSVIMQADADVPPASVPFLFLQAVDMFIQVGWAPVEGEYRRVMQGVYQVMDPKHGQKEDYLLGGGEGVPVVFRRLWHFTEPDTLLDLRDTGKR